MSYVNIMTSTCLPLGAPIANYITRLLIWITSTKQQQQKGIGINTRPHPHVLTTNKRSLSGKPQAVVGLFNLLTIKNSV